MPNDKQIKSLLLFNEIKGMVREGKADEETICTANCTFYS